MSPSVTMTILDQLFFFANTHNHKCRDLSYEEASWSMANSLNYKYTSKNDDAAFENFIVKNDGFMPRLCHEITKITWLG